MKNSEKQVVLLFLDAQQVFDNVKWKFMLQQLKYMDFNDKFINMFTAK